MENASKALIIAGAILLSILIIALGMSVYNSSSSVTDGANMDAQEISAHNSNFISYEGTKKGSQLSGLLTAIQNNNNDRDDRKIVVSVSSTTTSYNKAPLGISDGKVYLNNSNSNYKNIRDELASMGATTFKVSFGYNSDGLINYCEIHINK